MLTLRLTYLWLTSIVFLVVTIAASAGGAEVAIVVHDKHSGEVLPARVHLADAQGKPVSAGNLPFFKDHFSCPGRASVSLEAGAYHYEVERGPEYSVAAGSIDGGGTVKDLAVELERIADLAAEGWWCGELHVHRPAADIELLMRAEDLHFAPVITWWNNRNEWAGKTLPADLLTKFDENRFYHVMGGEDEREGGALLYFNLREPLNITGAQREYPPSAKFLAQARQHKNVWVDIEKPFWWDVPVWLSTGQCDSIGLANNHMNRSQMSETEAWGKPRDAQRLPRPTGNGMWTQELYYQILNAGIRIPPSAGSASGVLPNPVGYNRVYVHLNGEPTWDKWWEGLRAGHGFVTNGPLLRCTANGKLPGQVFKAGADGAVKIKLKAKLTTRDTISTIEIICNGKVERAVPYVEWAKTGSLGELTFSESGWFLIRAITDNPRTFRFASTAPFYVEIGERKRRISRAAAQFFLDWVRERMQRIKLSDQVQMMDAMLPQLRAEEFWKQRLNEANAE